MQTPNAIPGSNDRGAKRPVLLVEDDHETRLLLSLVLSHAGHSVITAQDGQQALDVLARGILPHIMIVDLLLPTIGGAHVPRQVARDARLRDVVTIAVSGDEAALANAPAAATFLKPLDPYVLVNSIGDLISRR